MEELINQIKLLQEKRIQLLEEYAIAKEREDMNAKFVLRKDNTPVNKCNERYMVIRISDGELIRYGGKSEIESFLKIRNLSNGFVFSTEIYPETIWEATPIY
jgi:hypothetical protein